MRAGCRAGTSPIDLFVNERGYTSVAVASALLASISLVFCLATVEWTNARAADVQDVADATALAGENAIARYCTIAQVVDACILSMGLCGMIVVGAGLVLAAIPGAQEASSSVLQTGQDVLDARNRFAKGAVETLKHIESVLPGIVVALSWSCAKENGNAGLAYVGAALPLPLESQSDFGSYERELDARPAVDSAERLQDAARKAQEQKERADESLERAWKADCVDDPRCMRSRARDLASLSDLLNPYVAEPRDWTFGMAIQRARSYYAERLAQEVPAGDDIESITDSLAREAFYEYALQEVQQAYYIEFDDGTVDLHVPHLARTSDEVRSTYLYTDAVWPCTQEKDGCTLHSTLSCPGATGASAGTDSVASVDAGSVRRCSTCGMDVGDLGSVASISTIATNGFEHYWQIVVEEAEAYRSARNAQAEAERETKARAEESGNAFQEMLDQLKVPRARICPPGAWGCVAVVMRKNGTAAPSELMTSFSGDVQLPAGIAVSAATLAPDESADSGNVVSRLIDGAVGKGSASAGSVARSVLALWGRLLVSYGSAFGGARSVADEYLSSLDGVFGGTAAAWLRRRVEDMVGVLGIEPADMRVKKPILVNTADVLRKAGIEPEGKIRQLIQAVRVSENAHGLSSVLGIDTASTDGREPMTVLSIPLPGTDRSVSLPVNLLGGGLS